MLGREIFVALCAKQIFVSKATRTDIRAVMDHSHLTFVVVFLAVLAETIIFVQAMVADLNTLSVTIDNVPSLGAIVLTFLTEFATVVIAFVTEKFGRKFASARNAQFVCSDIENLEVVLMVLANQNFGVEVGVNPITITAKAVTAGDMNTMFIAAIFFGLPEIGNLLQFGEFALNQIAIKF